MATFKTISSTDIKTTQSVLNQLVDFVEEDVSGSGTITRKKFQVFVTSSGDNAVTSSLFHTIYDQNYNLQTSNELFDMTVGLFASSDTVVNSSTGTDSNGKLLFPSQSLMMREKVNIYRQYAQLLLGDASAQFTAPFSNPSSDGSDNIDEALFIHFKRLFVRDGIKRETFAMKTFQSSSFGDVHFDPETPLGFLENKENFFVTDINTPTGSVILTDVGSSTSAERSPSGGDVGNLVDASDTSRTLGSIFYQQGVVVLDMKKTYHANQLISGSIQSVGSISETVLSGAFIPDLVTSASIDQILDHLTETRFGSGSNTVMTFQNNTKINSTLVFCRASADEFNFSSNPTYTNSEGRIRVIDSGQEGIQKSFSFISTIGLYDANEELLAVAKLSRPVEKNDEKDLTFRVRLDF